MPKVAIERIANNDAAMVKLDYKDHSVWQMKTDEYSTMLAEALKGNTTLRELNLDKCNITDVGTVAISQALRTQKGLEKLHLPNNKIGSVGLTAIAELLLENDSIVEINLFGNQRFGDPAVMALVDTLEHSNTTLCKIIWRMDNTKGLAWKLTKMLSRNVEIGRRKAQGNSYEDLDPKLNGERSAPASGSSSPAISPSASPNPRARSARHTVSLSPSAQREVVANLAAQEQAAASAATSAATPLRTGWTASKPSTPKPTPVVETTPPAEAEPEKAASPEKPAAAAEPEKPAAAPEKPAAAAEPEKAAAAPEPEKAAAAPLCAAKQAAVAALKEKLGEHYTAEVEALVLALARA